MTRTHPDRNLRGARVAAIAVVLAMVGCGSEQAPKPAAAPSAPPAAPAAATSPATPPAPVAAVPAAKPAPAVNPDRALATKVKATLEKDKSVPAQQIDVTAKDGKVTLWGTVADKGERERAAEIAKSVEGVKAVENKLVVVRGS